MSIKVFCDRCGDKTGKEPDPVVINILQYKSTVESHYHLKWKGDLCEPCLHALIRTSDPNNYPSPRPMPKPPE